MRNTNLLKNEELALLLKDLNRDMINLYGKRLKDIVLFGSYARGDSDEKSDMDIMILVDLNDEEQKKYRKVLIEKITDLSINYDIVISVIDNNYEDFYTRASYVPFHKNVVNEGIQVYAG